MTTMFRRAVSIGAGALLLAASALVTSASPAVAAGRCVPDYDIDIPDFKIDCYSAGGVLLGSGIYLEQSGDVEVIKACDPRYDSRRVTMYLEWDFSGGGQVSVSDVNGGGDGCGRKELNLRENYSYYITVCVETIACSNTYAVQG